MADPEPAERSEGPRAHRTEIQVRYGDTDGLGHVRSASYLSYAEVARLDFLGQLGHEIGSTTLAQLIIDFHLPVLFGDAVHIETRVERVGGTSMTLRQKLIAGGRLAAEMRSVVVLFDQEHNGQREIPPELREALAPYLAAST